MRIQNGEIGNKGKIKNAVTSARILVNDVEIFSPDDFKKKVCDLEAPVNLAEENTLKVELRGKPGNFLTVEIVQEIPAPSIGGFSAQPETISPGASSKLEWETENATSVVIDQGIGPVDPDGSILVSPLNTTQYTFTATSLGGAVEASVTVTVASAAPTATIGALPSEISPGESFVLSWDSSHAEYASLDNGIGAVALDGSMTLSATQTTLYTLTVTGQEGSASAQVQVTVLGNPEPQPEGGFGSNYQDLIPVDATLEAYAPERFAVVVGSVRDTSGEPLSDVSVSFHQHPEYGTATTERDGRFSIPVEGGGVMTLVFQKEDYITAHRKIHVPWNDIAVLETLKMITEDPASTEVVFDGNPNTIITHESSNVADEFGSRSCSLVFQGNNRAYAVDDDGNEMFELETITVRATEFTTEDSMPARLPPNSAYTYCVELSVDGVRNVVFEDPVITWVDNFLDFGVGEAVPVGYFDRIQGVWVPHDNGVVVRLLDQDMDGIADALDADGDGFPDDLNQNGTYDDEVMGLDNPSRYIPGDTFWRVAVTHFTPWDSNWPYGPPPGADPPNPEGTPDVDQPGPDDQSCPNPISSFVEDRSRILHEDIPVPGTGMTLHYAGNRVEGYKTVIKVPASGDTVPENLKNIVVEVDVAGRKLTQALNPLPDQMAEFVWDGLDLLGNRVYSAVSAHTRIGFVYDAVYYTPGDFSQAFAQAGSQVTDISARQEIIFWKDHQLTIRGENRGRGGVIAEGWTLSAHHSLDPVHPNVLLKGDGTKIKSGIEASGTLAGNGLRGYSGDGGPATGASFFYQQGIAVDNAGNLFIADTYNHSPANEDISVHPATRSVWWNSVNGFVRKFSKMYPTGILSSAYPRFSVGISSMIESCSRTSAVVPGKL